MSNEPGILPKPIPFGKYYLLERVNVGGMAEVYKAKAFGVEGFERLLAVKKILASIAEDEAFIEMFIDEAKIAGQLNHPNITQIFDLGRADNAYFIAMEYISGKDLKTIFERARRIGEKVDIPRVCYIIMKVCEGLAYAHEKTDASGEPLNIVHRDISPQNILISYEGEVKVIDFGIAKASGKQSQTEVGILKGKFSYMSPEQVRGLHVDHRSDIFSLGILFYELLTLERLFLGDSDFDTLEKIRKVEVSPPSLYNPHIPKELEDIALKALARSAEERYQSAHELAEALERFMRNQGYYFTNKDLASAMKSSFSADIEFENKKLDYYRGLNLQAPSPEGQPIIATADGGGLAWGEEEMETQIFDRVADEIEAVSESQIVFADDADIIEVDSLDDATIEYNRWDVQKQIQARSAAAPGATGYDGGAPLSAANGGRARGPTMDMAAVYPDDRPTPGTVHGPKPNRGDRKPLLVIWSVVALVLILGFGFYFMRANSSNSSIVFETDPPEVAIFIDDEEVFNGETPYTFKGPAGEIAIRIERDGYKPYERQQELVGGKNYGLNPTLEPAEDESARGSLLVKTEPPGAMIKVGEEGEEKKAPVTFEALNKGKHKVVASLEGYLEAEKEVETDEGNHEVLIKLRPETVSLALSSSPSAAFFSVYQTGDDGERVARGRTPETVKELAGDQDFRVVVELSGHERWEKRFEPGSDPSAELHAELTRSSSDSASSARSGSVATSGSASSGSSRAGGGSSGSTQAKPPAPTQPSKPKPAKPEPPKPAGSGTLTVGSKPAARVHINGKDTGRYTPLINFKIPAGKHTIRLVNEDFGLNKTLYVDVKPGENKKVMNR